MRTQQAERSAILVAGVVITILTAAAFWLSYAHLASVAQAHGLASSPERRWAWPATLDLFILAGEVLMFRAALQHVTDWWAIGLTVAGSVGSIGLNVAGVGTAAPFLDYVVAAVPPTAALLAFGALMRQVHSLVATPDEASEPAPVEIERIPDPEPTSPNVSEDSPRPSAEEPPEIEPPAPEPTPVAPTVPAALVDHAQKLADAHRTATGTPMDAATLRSRLGVTPPIAEAITAQLA